MNQPPLLLPVLPLPHPLCVRISVRPFIQDHWYTSERRPQTKRSWFLHLENNFKTKFVNKNATEHFCVCGVCVCVWPHFLESFFGGFYFRGRTAFYRVLKIVAWARIPMTLSLLILIFYLFHTLLKCGPEVQIGRCNCANHIINQQPRTTMVEKYLRVSFTCKEFQKATVPLNNLEIGMYFFPSANFCNFLNIEVGRRNFFFQICLKFFLHSKQCLHVFLSKENCHSWPLGVKEHLVSCIIFNMYNFLFL